ncbi:MAG: glycosyltransferase [Rhodospirillaceae bacterium]
MSGRLRVALILPVRNEAASVESTLGAICAATRLPDRIVVADGASTDGTPELLRAFAARVGAPVEVVDNPQIFAGGGRNVGAAAARDADILVFADFGNAPEANWLEHMVAPFEADPTIEVVASPVMPAPRTEFGRAVAAILHNRQLRLAQEPEGQREGLLRRSTTPGGLSLAIRQATWQRMCGMPGWLRAAEDKLFGRKLAARGIPFTMAWQTAMRYHMRENFRDLLHQHYVYGRGDGQSGYMRNAFLRTLAVWVVLVGLLSAGAWTLAAPLAALVLFGAYIWRRGVRHMVRAEGQGPTLRQVRLAILVVLGHDLGVLAGYAVGWSQWLFKPRFRHLQRAYMSAGGADGEGV